MLRTLPTPPSAAVGPQRFAGASGSVTVLTLDELARDLPRLQPPAAYRLSLDSGIGYKNIRRACEQPMAVRLHTWQRLLRSLRIRLVAAASAEDLAGPGASTRLVGFGPPPSGLAAAADTASLQGCRLALGWSRRELARRAGVGLDAVVSLERGQGLAGSLDRVCGALGLRLFLALPPAHSSLEELWVERAGGCLAEPAQFPPARARSRPASHRRRQLPAARND